MKILFKNISVLFLLLGFYHLEAQQLSTENKKAIKYYKEAESYVRQKNYAEAEEVLMKALSKDENFKEAMLLLGDVLRDEKKNDEAISIYEKLLILDANFYPPTYYFLGELYLNNEEFDKAISSLQTFIHNNNSGDGRTKRYTTHKILSSLMYEKALFAKHAKENPLDSDIRRIEFPVNSNNEDYINYVNPTGNYMVFTRKDYGDLGVASSYFREYFMESHLQNETWSAPKEIHIPDTKGNTGGMTLTFDGKKMYFTGCNWPDNEGSCDIYTSKKQKGYWSKAIILSHGINSASWDSQASVSADGNTIYFTSKRKGGKGGSDIWKSEKLENGSWSPSINLGDSVNTAANEMAPYIHPDGKTLYYSSNRLIGMGGYDLFISRRDIANQWTKGKNLGYPINTKFDEINIFPSLDGKQAWISSNRNHDSTFYDIYSLKLNSEIKPDNIIVFNGFVIDKKTRLPLNSTIEITDIGTGKIFSTSESDQGDGSFVSVLFPNKDYAFNISKDGYLFYSANFNFDMAEVNYEGIFELSKIEKGTSVNLRNIYFDTDKWDLKHESYPELNKLYKMLTDNPQVNILIEGHTDNIGTEDHNLKLSRNRAKSVMDYLISKGISPSRLSHEGKGSEFPVAENSSDRGRSLNRRTTIIVK